MTYKNAFPVTRKQHLTETAEDYTELISDLIEEFGEARIGKIAERLAISHVTALRTIERLQRDGFVTTEPRKPVLLTRKGEKLAAFSRERHQVVFDLLVTMGVPAKTAAQDVEGIEHHVSPETLAVMKRFLKKLSN